MSESEAPKQEFAAILLQVNKGLAHDKASEELRAAVAAVKELGKPAEMTVKLKITPVKNNSSVVQIEAATAVKIPKPPVKPAIFFADDEGGLHRNDPTQRSLYDPPTEHADGKTAAAGKDN